MATLSDYSRDFATPGQAKSDVGCRRHVADPPGPANVGDIRCLRLDAVAIYSV